MSLWLVGFWGGVGCFVGVFGCVGVVGWDGYVGCDGGVSKVFAIYQLMLGWKTCKYYCETDELPNPRPTQSNKI